MPPYSLDDFTFDLRRAVPPAEIWVGSGTGTVTQLAGSVCGVAGWFSPPLAAPDSRLTISLEVDGRDVVDAARPGAGNRGILPTGGTWRPDRLIRRGTYHHYADSRMTSFAVESILTPRHGSPGYVLTLVVRNRSNSTHELTIHPELTETQAHNVPLSGWGWVPPAAGSGEPITLSHAGLSATLEPQGEVTFTLTVNVAPTSDVTDAEHTTREWESRLAQALHRLPTLTSDIPGLEQYYRRSLASGLVCWWDHPDFVTQPFIATSGLDGGALCAYAWDTGGYAPNVLSLMLGDSVLDIIESLLDADLTDRYAIAPDGTGLGVAYAYSGWSLVALTRAAAAEHRLDPTVVARLYDVLIALDKQFQPDDQTGVLRDYGDQSNLLEMRGSGWEHVVASPNAERAWALETLAELSDLTGAALPADDLRASAQQIREEVIRQLWDDEAGWFRTRYPDGHTELTYSIQAYDVLRSGACPPEVAAALLKHLRPDAFLGEYGVSSVSGEDELHYETADIDWSGAGAYTGEGPQLALTLWERGEPDLAWDVLRRHLWLGDHYPYFPQDHYSDKPGAPATGRRINVIAGLTGAEAVLTGLAGIRPHPDGSLTVHPQPVAAGNISVHGLGYRGHTIDVAITPEGFQVSVDGRRLSPGQDGTILAVSPRS
ncbi:MGH1-like glycoside hydrolase domain-containing protein [Kribbella sp. NBC_00359]|uniref:MGH1-like glycoside hydrolase domain-containing protein n=1 Tax=Kribbella sp. NBC_00359 TaxID=2975966 RepID=UPI002E2437CB